MEKSVKIKKFGVGSLSLFISIFSIIFSFTYVNGDYIGVHIMRSLGLSIPTSIISIILFLIAIFIGIKYKEDRFAKFGKVLSIIFIGLIAILSLTSFIF